MTASGPRTTVRAVLSRFSISVSLLAVVAALTFAGGASAATTCKPPKYPGSGYFTSLSVTKTTCSVGGKVANAYYKCRTAKSVKGRCSTKKKILGYSCRETRRSIATEIDGRVTCKRGSKRVVHSYQQDV